jgi:DNA recombination protein RmuC
MTNMNTLFFAVGLLAGIIIGGSACGFFLRRSRKDAESIAESLSAKVVAKQAEQILQLAESKLSGKKELIDSSLKNVKGDLDRVERLMRSIGDGNVKIDTRLGDAAKVIKELSETTGNLRNALTSNSNRGQWGERMAEDVLRLSGLIEGINYIKQKKITSGASKPDFTFMLPQNLKLNMDVKFPFNNYQLYAEATTEDSRDKYKKAFLKDVKNRIKEVQTRDYINPEDNTVDYVVLFIPNEQIFSFINEIDRSLIDEAMRGKTILCSPLSLYAVLSVIRQSIDNFSFESKSQEALSILGAFKMQWEKFKEQMETVQDRFESVHKGYEELTGTRERQLDRQLTKLEELRLDRGAPLGEIEETLERVTTKNALKAGV